MRKKYELLVIGGGPAGITLAKKLGNIYHIAVIRPEPKSMIYCAMPYVVEGILPIEKTFKKDDLITDSGSELIVGTVISVNEKEKTVSLTDGKVVGFEKLVIATGAEPFVPDISGVEKHGVFVFKTQNDLEKLLIEVKKIKNAVVVGAGAIGIELAQAINSIGIRTHIVEMAGNILPNMMDEEMSEPAKIKLLASGIRLHLSSKIIKIEGTERAEAAIMDNGVRINLEESEPDCADGGAEKRHGIIIFAAGVKPSLDFIEKTSISRSKNGIIVNAYMETNVEDIYACGDCVEFVSGINKKKYPGKLATNAVPMAKVLAHGLKGLFHAYPGFYNGAATKVGDLYLGSSGFTEKEALKLGYDTVTAYSEFSTKFPVMPGALPLKTKLVADRNTGILLGGQIVSREPVAARIDLITMAIQNRLTVEGVLGHSYSAQPYQSYYPAENGFVAAAEKIYEKIMEPSD